jgi:hypothetical protein
VSAALPELQRVILRVLSGDLTEKMHPAYFDDDVFFLCVRQVEREDRAWLMAVLRDRSYSRDTRGLVAMQMTNEGHRELIVELFAERAPN